MVLMGSRLEIAQRMLQGYLKTGILFTDLVNNKIVSVGAGCADDLGFYYWVTLLAKGFNLSAYSAAYCFLSFIYMSALCIAVSSYWYASDNKIYTLLATTLIVYFMRRAWWYGDVYLMALLPVACIPWGIIFFEKRWWRISVGYCFFSGLLAALSHFVRAYSGHALCLFIAVSLITTRFFSWQKKRWLFIALVSGYGLGALYTTRIIILRNRYCVQENGMTERHVFWHAVYLGLGFIKNKYNIIFDDSYGAQTFNNEKKGIQYPNKKYEAACKKRFFEIVKQDCGFVIKTVAAKMGILLLCFLLFANFGFLFSLFKKRNWRWDLPWAVAVGWSALPGILVLPEIAYVLGFCFASLLYGLFLLQQKTKRI